MARLGRTRLLMLYGGNSLRLSIATVGALTRILDGVKGYLPSHEKREGARKEEEINSIAWSTGTIF